MRQCASFGDLDPEEALEWLRNVLKQAGMEVKGVRSYGRMTVIKLGFLKKLILLRQESTKETIVCGPQRIISELSNYGLRTRKPITPRRTPAAERIIRKQVLRHKIVVSEAYLLTLAAIEALFLSTAYRGGDTLILSAIIATLSLTPVPLPGTGYTEWAIPALLPKYLIDSRK